MSEAQKRAYAELSPGRVLGYGTTPLDWRQLFPDAGKIIVEIGFGMGDATRQMAAAHPDWGILGIEVHPPGVGKLLWWMKELELDNIRIVEHDAVEVMRNMIPPGSVDGVHIWFPDPWPKKKHHKRRLIQPDVVSDAVRCLKPGGYIHAATDWEPYAEHILEVFRRREGLVNTAESWAEKPEYRPYTKFENRGVAENRLIRDIIFKKESS